MYQKNENQFQPHAYLHPTFDVCFEVPFVSKNRRIIFFVFQNSLLFFVLQLTVCTCCLFAILQTLSLFRSKFNKFQQNSKKNSKHLSEMALRIPSLVPNSIEFLLNLKQFIRINFSYIFSQIQCKFF